MNDLATWAEIALKRCGRCNNLTGDKRAARIVEIIADINRTRARILEPLPATAWPNGRAPHEMETA